ncbi:protein bric-a-brac 1-like isoform X20 [Palaemon carinicauda]|uniref:protein bric-a-brac 1-like isoform X20 n=1 Tax=Palaemon carinicauda TaxID=392227 RepID=UPI0035B58A42
MGADQQFCLRWNNFHSNITSAFESLRDDEDFVDITLACEGRQIKAHKMVLSACSPYFRSLLKGNPCQHPIVFLKDVTFSNLSSILDFMYHGEVNVSHNELATFLKTAEALKVRGLAEDEKKKDSENYNETSSPPPPRDPPDPGSPRPEEGSSAPDTHLSDSPPPKRLRRRSGNSVHSTEDTNETVLSDQPIRDTSVKNEPQDFNEEEDILSQSVDQDVIKSDVVDDDRNFGPAESVTIRSQAAMQQLQESFGSFLPGMGQSPGFLPHGATDMPRPPPYPLEGVQGLPPGISALPGPSMSQGAASQDASQGGLGRSWSRGNALGGGGGVGGEVGVRVPHLHPSGENPNHTAPHTSTPATLNLLPYHTDVQQPLAPAGGDAGGLPPSLQSGGGGFSYVGDETCVCPHCGKCLRDKYKVRRHIEDVHTPSSHSHQCTLCHRRYKTRNTLQNHMSIYHRHQRDARSTVASSSSSSFSKSSSETELGIVSSNVAFHNHYSLGDQSH